MSLGILLRVHSWSGEETPLSDGGIVAGSATGVPDLNVDDDVLLNGIGLPAFILDEQSRIAAWNTGMESLTGTSAADALGRRDPGETLYGNTTTRVLTGQVLDNPRNAASLNDVELDNLDRLLYAVEETFANANGDGRHARRTAVPLYEGDKLVGILQTVRNRATEVERHREVATLVSEVGSTLTQLSRGNLGTRATIDDSRAVNDQLYLVVNAVNETARNLLTLASDVEDETETAATVVARVASAADIVAENVNGQHDLLDEDATQIQQFSVTMKEVTATTNEVDTAATEARQTTTEDREANSEAREATESVVTMGDKLADRVTKFGDRMDNIEAVVEVISEVIEQTSLLALNANIEAAHAGEDGDGFAVATEEVKSLADETRQHTEDVTAQIENIQSQADETVHAATESNDRIEHTDERISEMLAAFEGIATSINTAADSVAEVPHATDKQAEAVEELTATIGNTRDRAIETEGAVDDIVAATDGGAQVLPSLATEVEELTRSRSA